MSELEATNGLLRAATAGDREDAIRRLRTLYGTFTEGFDAPDLVEAREVLELGGSPSRGPAEGEQGSA